MAKLMWSMGTGPKTTQELAQEIRREGRIGRDKFICYEPDDTGRYLRCLWGVIEDYYFPYFPEPDIEYSRRTISSKSWYLMRRNRLRESDNDRLMVTPEERCEILASRMEQIP